MNPPHQINAGYGHGFRQCPRDSVRISSSSRMIVTVPLNLTVMLLPRVVPVYRGGTPWRGKRGTRRRRRRRRRSASCERVATAGAFGSVYSSSSVIWRPASDAHHRSSPLPRSSSLRFPRRSLPLVERVYTSATVSFRPTPICRRKTATRDARRQKPKSPRSRTGDGPRTRATRFG